MDFLFKAPIHQIMPMSSSFFISHQSLLLYHTFKQILSATSPKCVPEFHVYLQLAFQVHQPYTSEVVDSKIWHLKVHVNANKIKVPIKPILFPIPITKHYHKIPRATITETENRYAQHPFSQGFEAVYETITLRAKTKLYNFTADESKRPFIIIK